PPGIHGMPGGASPSVERGTSLQPEPGGLLNGSALGSGDRLDLDRPLVDRASKCHRDRIFLAHRCRQVLADIGTFVAGKCIGLGPRNPAFGDGRAIARNPPASARAGLAAVIGELEANMAVARWHRPRRHEVVALPAEPVVGKPRPPLLEPKAPAA